MLQLSSQRTCHQCSWLIPLAGSSISFFTRTNIVYLREGVSHFYPMGVATIPAVRVNAGPEEKVEHMKTNLERAVAAMVHENKETWNQLNRQPEMMENFMQKFLEGSATHGPGMRAQTDQKTRPSKPSPVGLGTAESREGTKDSEEEIEEENNNLDNVPTGKPAK